MLVGAHQRRHPVGQRQAEAVGADVALGVGETRREMDVVERLEQGAVAGQPRQHHTLGVGEHHADRLVGQGAVQVGQHLVTALEEQRTEVVGAGEDRFDRLRAERRNPRCAARTRAIGGTAARLAVCQFMQPNAVYEVVGHLPTSL